MVNPGTATAAVGSATIGLTVIKEVYLPLKRWYNDTKNLKKNRQKLDEVRPLLDMDIPGKEDEVQEYKDRLAEVDRKYGKARRSTLRYFKRANPSKKMKELADQIAPLRNQVYSPRIRSDSETDESPWVRGYVRRILELLRDNKRIGIHGFMGTGKSTIMRSLNDEAYKTGLFNYVIFVTVGEAGSVKSIQRAIAEELKLGVASIEKALLNKKYLLLLDQVSEQSINLRKLKIRLDKVVAATNYIHICDGMNLMPMKVKMTTKDALYLFNKIMSENPPAVQTNRIKTFIDQIVRECGNIAQMIEAVARHLKLKSEGYWEDFLTGSRSSNYGTVREFGDLNAAFKTLCDRLVHPRKDCFHYGALFPIDHNIHEDHLVECWRAERFIPEAGGSNVSQIFRTARHDGYNLLNQLVSASLLDRCEQLKYVKIPSLFRIFVLNEREELLSLVESNNGVLESTSSRNDDRLRATRISIKCISSSLDPSIGGVDTKIISTLFLQRSERLVTIPDSIFVLESKLQVLDLGYTGITSLPPSIFRLENLTALYLNNCTKMNSLPPEIRQLSLLEILDIRRTQIPNWPDEIRHLTGLRCLRVSFVKLLNGTAPQPAPDGIFSRFLNKVRGTAQPQGQDLNITIFSSLRSLEELTIIVDEAYYQTRGNNDIDGTWNDRADEIVGYIASLSELTTLRFHFPTVHCLASFIRDSASWKNKGTRWRERTFRSFKLIVGSPVARREIDLSEHMPRRHLKFFASNCNEIPNAISEVLSQSCTFELIGHKKIKHLSSFGIERIEGLEVCVIEDCKRMTSIVAPRGDNEGVHLPRLKQLHLIRLRRLTKICEGLVDLANLTTLTIKACRSLTVILPREISQRIPLLENLRVEGCLGVVVIIGQINEDVQNPNPMQDIERAEVVQINPNILLPKLKRLELVNLPTLASICRNVEHPEWGSLQEARFDRCPMLRNIHFTMENARQLKSIHCQEACWNALTLEDVVRSRYRPYCHFIP